MSDESSGSQVKTERVIGTYLYPLGLFGQPPSTPTSAIVTGDLSSLEPNHDWYSGVICRVNTGLHEVMVTRMSGLFVSPPDTFSDPTNVRYEGLPPDYEDKKRFQEEVARSFNLLICELAFRGVVSEPAAPAQIAGGVYKDGRAIITMGQGGREFYKDRQTSPWIRITKGDMSDWTTRSEVALVKAARLSRAKQLASISETLPTLVAGAYSQFSQGQLSEALINSFIVIEQIIDHYWRQDEPVWRSYANALPTRNERDRILNRPADRVDVSVRVKVLLDISTINSSLYNEIERARVHRNTLAHRAKVSLSAAKDCLAAMKATIEFFCKATVEPPLLIEHLGW